MPQGVASAQEATRYRVAGFWRRSVASLVDAVVLTPLVLAFGGAASAIAGGALPRVSELGFDYLVRLTIGGGTAGLVSLTMGAIVILLYMIVFWATSGQTLGKRLVRARVIDAYGDSPSLPRALARMVGLLASVALFGLGWLWIGFSREKRGLHDLVAGTWVVRVAPQPGGSAVGATSS
jgi:uncharacterized RDD family membrane protein YckC